MRLKDIYINNIILNKAEFDHFLKGDEEVWFDDERGELITKEEGMRILDQWERDDDEDPEITEKDLLRENHLFKTYDDLVDSYENWYEDGKIDYTEVGDKVVLTIVNCFE